MKGLIVNARWINTDKWAEVLEKVTDFHYLGEGTTAEQIKEHLRQNDYEFIILQPYHGTDSNLYFAPNYRERLTAREVQGIMAGKTGWPKFVWIEACGAMNRTGLAGVNWVSAFSLGDLSGLCIGGLHHIDTDDWDDYIGNWEKDFVKALALGESIEYCMDYAAMAAKREELYITVLGDTSIRLSLTTEPVPEPEPPPPPDDDLDEFILAELALLIDNEVGEIQSAADMLRTISDRINASRKRTYNAINRIRERLE